jgi:AraC-like DNA-binding protein
MPNRWAEAPTPWRADAKSVTSSVQSHVAHDALACGLIDLDKPQMDEFLFCQGFTPDSAQKWVAVGFQRDALLRTAQQHGSGTGLLQDTGLEGAKLEPDSFAAAELLPIGVADRRMWWLCAARASSPFTVGEREALRLLLHQWRAEMARPQEPGLMLAVVGGDNRLIFADPFLLARLQEAGMSVAAFLGQVEDVREQRWPDTKVGESHDMALELGGEVVWVVVRRQRACDIEAADRWLLEIRPMEEDELPGIGVLSDDRVAQALALVHDQYHTSPTLNDLSNAVHVSPFHFHRLFSRQVGISPKQYLLMKQLQVGRWRLRRGLEPIGEIALATGFANHAHFTSTFRRALGMSPSEYQQNFMRGLEPSGAYGAGPGGRKRKKTRRKKKA